jgi:penicillin-binding protein 2
MFVESPPPRHEPVPDPLPLAIRAAALAVIGAILLAILLFRLWALQVLHTQQYSAQALQNQVRTSAVPARRGDIVDRNGRVLVSNSVGIAVQVNSATFPTNTNCGGTRPVRRREVASQPGCAVLARVARVLRMPLPRVWNAYRSREAINQGYPVTLPFAVTRQQVAYILERHVHFPWIQFQRVYLRDYPALHTYGPIDPNLIGHVGPITADNLKDPAFRNEHLPQIGIVGQSGIEKTYDAYLRGADGETAQAFDASGEPVRPPYLVTAPQSGSSVRLTLDAHLQQVAQAALVRGVAIAHANGEYQADYGAVVAMNPRNGAIYAMASNPTYSPEVWVPPYKGQRAVVNPNNPLSPQVDKAFAGQYPAGSTFKPITAVAAWMSHLIGPGSVRPCTTDFTSQYDHATPKTVFKNWGPVNATIGLSKALEISCDTFFYHLGDEFYGRGTLQFQDWIKRLGYGAAPKIDVPGAVPGLVPDAQWKAQQLWLGAEAQRVWDPGDDINMAIGQGYLLVTPLQQAVAYSALENGGTVVTPHLGGAVLGPDGRVVPGGNLTPAPQRSLHLPASLLAEIRTGLYGATHAGDGTSTSTFGAFQPTVYGKTGTAEAPTASCANCADAWWAGWAQQGGRPLVVVAMIHNGGHGGVSAAPVAAQVFSAFFHTHYTLHSGQDQSR